MLRRYDGRVGTVLLDAVPAFGFGIAPSASDPALNDVLLEFVRLWVLEEVEGLSSFCSIRATDRKASVNILMGGTRVVSVSNAPGNGVAFVWRESQITLAVKRPPRGVVYARARLLSEA